MNLYASVIVIATAADVMATDAELSHMASPVSKMPSALFRTVSFNTTAIMPTAN